MRGFHQLFVLSLPLAMAATLSQAQTRASVAFGATWLDFSIGGVGAVSAQVRFTRGAFELSTQVIAPLGGVHAVPDCPPNVSCFARSTPDVVLGAAASLGKSLGTSGWRGSVGVGTIGVRGMEGPPESRTSATGTLGLDWTSKRKSGLTPTLGVRASGLAHAIGGMRYVIVPSIGITF